MRTEEADLLLTGMTCDHCVQTVEKGVQALVGVEQVCVDLATQKVQVRYAPSSVTLDEIRRVITHAGYKVL